MFLCLVQRIATEITVLQSLHHPLLPQLHQVYTTGDEICLEMTVSREGLVAANSALQLMAFATLFMLVCCISHTAPAVGYLAAKMDSRACPVSIYQDSSMLGRAADSAHQVTLTACCCAPAPVCVAAAAVQQRHSVAREAAAGRHVASRAGESGWSLKVWEVVNAVMHSTQ